MEEEEEVGEENPFPPGGYLSKNATKFGTFMIRKGLLNPVTMSPFSYIQPSKGDGGID